MLIIMHTDIFLSNLVVNKKNLARLSQMNGINHKRANASLRVDTRRH